MYRVRPYSLPAGLAHGCSTSRNSSYKPRSVGDGSGSHRRRYRMYRLYCDRAVSQADTAAAIGGKASNATIRWNGGDISVSGPPSSRTVCGDVRPSAMVQFSSTPVAMRPGHRPRSGRAGQAAGGWSQYVRQFVSGDERGRHQQGPHCYRCPAANSWLCRHGDSATDMVDDQTEFLPGPFRRYRAVAGRLRDQLATSSSAVDRRGATQRRDGFRRHLSPPWHHPVPWRQDSSGSAYGIMTAELV